LEYDAAPDFALASMRDDADQVLAVAIDLLLPLVKDDRNPRSFPQGFYASHRGREGVHLRMSLLEAYGITLPPVTAE